MQQSPAGTQVDPGRDGRTGRRNALILSVCQGLFTCAISIDLTLTGLTGYQLAPDKLLATLPFAMITVAGAFATLFASFLMQRIGRQLGFALGSLICALGGGISVWSVFAGNFWTFCVGTSCVGIFQAFAQYYRLAAANSVETARKSRAISTVLAGGVTRAGFFAPRDGWRGTARRRRRRCGGLRSTGPFGTRRIAISRPSPYVGLAGEDGDAIDAGNCVQRHFVGGHGDRRAQDRSHCRCRHGFAYRAEHLAAAETGVVRIVTHDHPSVCNRGGNGSIVAQRESACKAVSGQDDWRALWG